MILNPFTVSESSQHHFRLCVGQRDLGTNEMCRPRRRAGIRPSEQGDVEVCIKPVGNPVADHVYGPIPP